MNTLTVVSLIALIQFTAPAGALKSAHDCREALAEHVQANWITDFTRLYKAPRMDLNGDATILLNVEGEDELILDPTSRLTNHPELSFALDGDRFVILTGPLQALAEENARIAAVNGGRRLDFQILERDELPPTTVAAELRRRMPRAFDVVTNPLRKVDEWLRRLAPYRRAREYVTARTASARSRVALALQRRRNPVDDFEPEALSEVAECLGKACRRPVNAREHAAFLRMEAFLAHHAPGISIREPGGLARATLAVLDHLSPELHLENQALVKKKRLGAFDFATFGRDARQFYLMSAFELIESRVWPGRASGRYERVNVKRTFAEYDRLVSAERPARRVSLAHLDSEVGEKELNAPEFQRLRETYPVTLVSGEIDDFKWLLISERFARTQTHRVREQARAVLGDKLGDDVDDRLAGLLAGGTPGLAISGRLDTLNLEALALSQVIAHYESTSGDAYWVVPAMVGPEIVYAQDVDLTGVDRAALEKALVNGRSMSINRFEDQDQILYREGDQLFLVIYGYTPGERESFRVTGVRAASRDVAVKHYKRLAERLGLEAVSVTYPESRRLNLYGTSVSRVIMHPVAIVESMVSGGLSADEISGVVNRVGGDLALDQNRCAEVEDRYLICFGKILKNVANVKLISAE